MIHIINKHNRDMYTDVLVQMFQIRYDIFVEGKGWKALDNILGLERDQFDTPETVYFLKLDIDLKIIGGIRLVPTASGSQLNTIFRDWCTLRMPPRDQKVYEWSRFFVLDPAFQSNAGNPIFSELFSAILEYALIKGCVGLTGFLEHTTFDGYDGMPWPYERMGETVKYGGSEGEPIGEGVATYTKVDRQLLHVKVPYFALPLGDVSPTPHMAYPPAVAFESLAFLECHPEHTDLMILVACVFGDQRVGSREDHRELIAKWVRDEALVEIMDGFTKPIPQAHLHTEVSLKQQ
ncbi:MAG: GNAT family N-acetyltransferase [Kordiimonadaceae bacterium]|nr:GNAT family N-acetyltransferase [Kordiimonadaceae bacterium]